jgi:hypothetical protein
MVPFLEFGLLVRQSRTEYNSVLCWINPSLPRTQGDFRYCRRAAPTSTRKIARRKQLTLVLSSSAAEVGSGRLRSDMDWALSCAGSARLKELSAALPAPARPRFRALMKASMMAADRSSGCSRATPLPPTSGNVDSSARKVASGPMAVVFKRGRRRRNGSGINVGEHSDER